MIIRMIICSSRLGRGGMGEVFLATLKGRGLSGVDKICVIKTLRPSNDPEYERRFIDEARLIVLLGHKNIAAVFDAGCFEGEYYLAMEHVAGRELRSLQRASEARGQPMPAAVVIHIIKEILEALDAAHRMTHPLTREALRVVHRDVSPQNVMVSSEGEVKLIDFGLAVSTQKVERTAPQIVMGKMAYMAPEQARGDGVDGRVDQFACGIMLYELLANQRYYGDLPFDVMWRASGSGGHAPTLLHTLPNDVRAIIVKATAAAREDRYASCGDMRDALTAVELRRGMLAGSRDVRAAQTELDNLSMPSLAPPIPPPSAQPPTMDFESLPKERTRTFRLITAEGAGPAVIEGLEPGAATMSTRVSSATPVTTSLATLELKPVEHTVVMRSVPTPAAPVVSSAAPPTASSSKAPLLAIAVMVAIGLVLLVVIVGRGATDVAVIDAGMPTVVAFVDAGDVVDVVDDVAVIVVGMPTVVAFVDGGDVVDVVDAGVVVDAGSVAVEAAVDAGSADAGTAAAVAKKLTPTKPKGRELPPLPDTTRSIIFRTKLLSDQCADVSCTKAVMKRLRSQEPAAQLEPAVAACYALCLRTPKP